MPLPLKGLTVVSIEQAVAAPFATRQLADLGARVIKIERPDGGDFARSYDSVVNGLSTYFVWLNRSKESLTLNLKRPDAQDVLGRLLSKADVFVQNVAPGASRRLGTSTAELRDRFPTLVVCNVSGYGSSGPYTNKKAYDLLIQSEVGLISITGTPESPSKVGISVADMAAGTYAYSGILAALLARATSGKGTAIEVSLFDALGEWMGPAAYYTMYGGAALPRSGPNHASITPYGPYASKEGGPVYLAIQHAREWARFCADVLGQPLLADDERFRTNVVRVRHRAELDDAINRVFSTLTAQEILDRLDAAGIASARMNSVAEFVRHPQLSGRNRWREIPSPAGPLLAPMPPVHMEDVEPVMGAVPALGQQTDAILEEFGFHRDQIDQWRREGTI